MGSLEASTSECSFFKIVESLEKKKSEPPRGVGARGDYNMVNKNESQNKVSGESWQETIDRLLEENKDRSFSTLSLAIHTNQGQIAVRRYLERQARQKRCRKVGSSRISFYRYSEPPEFEPIKKREAEGR